MPVTPLSQKEVLSRLRLVVRFPGLCGELPQRRGGIADFSPRKRPYLLSSATLSRSPCVPCAHLMPPALLSALWHMCLTSPAFNMEWLRTLEWLLYLLQNRRLRSFLVAPPCTTYSPAAHPACRSYAKPRGFQPTARKTLLGTILALRALTLLFVALLVGAIGVLEQPRLAKMAWLAEWRRLLLPGAREFWTASCSFGSMRRKEFRFLAVGIDLSPICKPCTRDHSHIRVEGKYTRESAKYTPLLADALAHEFSQALRRDSHVASSVKINVSGLENPILNDIVLSSAWIEGDAWHWRCPVHINILESAAVLRLLRSLAFSGPKRIVVLVDSSVALCSAAKGRSPSRGLTPVIRKMAAVCLLAGLCPAFHFVPTRLNPADCPTRDYPLPPPAQVYEGLAAPKLRRWAANWARLLLLLTPHVPGFRPHLGWRNFHRYCLDFDQTLGFPGEGPFLVKGWFFVVWGLTWGIVGSVVPSHGALQPRNKADETRMRSRAAVVLQEGRPVETATRKRREKLLSDFVSWLSGIDVPFDSLLSDSLVNAHVLNEYLVQYGRSLFEAGWPYSHYSEVINAIAAKEPLLRRSLQPSWDLAFSWMREEPHVNHVAMPWQLLLAAIAISLVWGWPRVAGILALTWGGLLRIGEAFTAKRSDLLLPGDVNHTCDFALLSVGEPKTRYKAARHQSAKIDQPDLLRVISLAFGAMGFPQKLWPQSSATFRNRFDMIMKRLEISHLPFEKARKLDLGSLRAGGATWLLSCTEDAELVRRRGRWLNHRTMEIYIQEVSSLQFIHRLPVPVQEKVYSLVRAFEGILSRAEQLVLLRTPTTAWYSQFSVG